MKRRTIIIVWLCVLAAVPLGWAASYFVNEYRIRRHVRALVEAEGPELTAEEKKRAEAQQRWIKVLTLSEQPPAVRIPERERHGIEIAKLVALWEAMERETKLTPEQREHREALLGFGTRALPAIARAALEAGSLDSRLHLEDVLVAIIEGNEPRDRQTVERLLCGQPVEVSRAFASAGFHRLDARAGVILAGHPGGRGAKELLPFLDSRDAFHRIVCMQALVSLDEKRAVPRLIEMLDDLATAIPGPVPLVYAPDFVGAGALLALRKLTGQNFGTDKAAWRAWWEANKEKLLQGATPFPGKAVDSSQ